MTLLEQIQALRSPRPNQVTKHRLWSDLLTDDQKQAIDLLEWQAGQLSLEDRTNPTNPLPLVPIIMREVMLPAEYVELDNPRLAAGLRFLAMLGAPFDEAEIARILANVPTEAGTES